MNVQYQFKNLHVLFTCFILYRVTPKQIQKELTIFLVGLNFSIFAGVAVGIWLCFFRIAMVSLAAPQTAQPCSVPCRAWPVLCQSLSLLSGPPMKK